MFGKKEKKVAAGEEAAAESTAKTGAVADAGQTIKTAKGAKAAKPTKEAKPTKPVKAAKEPKPTKPPKPAKAAKVAAAPKAKSSKRKNALPKGGPGFFAAHIEKLILAGCLAAVGYLVYAGFSTPGYETSAVPEKLEKDAKDLMTKISQDHWEEIAADPERKVEHDFANRVADARRPTDHNAYENAVWDPKPLGVFEKRGDPKIFPPEQLVVTTVNGALAIEVSLDDADPYEDLEDAEPIRSKTHGRDGRRAGRGGSGSADGSGSGGSGSGGGYGDMMGAGGGAMMGGAMAGNASSSLRLLPTDNNMGYIFGGSGGMGGYGGSGGGGSMGSMMMGAGGMGAGGMAAAGANGAPIRDGLKNSNKERGPKTKIGSRAILFNAITAVVPHRKMVEEYLAQFEESGNFMPQRDMPVYMSFELQRVEVTGDPNREIKENEWKDLSDGLAQSNFPITQKWATNMMPRQPVPEVIDRNSFSAGLTMPIPPILIRDYRQFSKHPAVHWAWDTRSQMPRQPQRRNQTPKESTVLPGARAGAAAGGMGGMGGMGGGQPMGGR
ncbi:MAG: hypothetical protein ABI557_14345, partial [Aureliella sp.]